MSKELYVLKDEFNTIEINGLKSFELLYKDFSKVITMGNAVITFTTNIPAMLLINNRNDEIKGVLRDIDWELNNYRNSFLTYLSLFLAGLSVILGALSVYLSVN